MKLQYNGKSLQQTVPRVMIVVFLILDIALLSLAGLIAYNKFFRYEFQMVFLGVRASHVLENGEIIALVFDEKEFIRDHLFEPPRWLKSLIK